MAKSTPTLSPLTVIDAKKSVHLIVNEADAAASLRNDPRRCMIAQAAIRELQAVEVRIHKSRAYIRIKDHWVRYILSEGAVRELVAFDRGGRPVAFETNLLAPAHGERLGERKGFAGTNSHKAKGKRKGKPRSLPRTVTANVRTDMPAGVSMHEALGA
jgi:hypothetical protein